MKRNVDYEVIMSKKSDFEKYGYIIPGLKHIKKLGEGVSGNVFLMREESQVGFLRAVKILNPSVFSNKEELRKRFKQETSCIENLQHHSVVSLKHSGFSSDESKSPYLVMEYVEGKSLMDTFESLNIVEKAKVVSNILKTLEYVHEKGILHRDIKPKNIVIRESDKAPVIVDFGCSYVLEEIKKESLTTASIGTVGYIPPEVMSNPKNRSFKHDIYSCGAMLYRILDHEPPNYQKYKELSTSNKQLSGLDIIIKKAIGPEEKRYKSAKEFSDSILNWVNFVEQKEAISIDLDDFRDKVLQKKREGEERRKIEQEKKERMNLLSKNAENYISPIVEKIFEDFCSVLNEIYGNSYKIENETVSVGIKNTVSLNRSGVKVIAFSSETFFNKYPLEIAKFFSVKKSNNFRQADVFLSNYKVPKNLLNFGWKLYKGSGQSAVSIVSIVASIRNMTDENPKINFYYLKRAHEQVLLFRDKDDIVKVIKKALEGELLREIY